MILEVLKNSKKFLVDDWKHNRQLFFIENLGTFFGLCAATLIAVNTIHTPFLLAYLLFTACSIFLIVAAYKRNSCPVIVLNFGYLLINAYGLWNAIQGMV